MGDMNFNFGEFIRKSQFVMISKQKVDDNGNRVVELLEPLALKNNPIFDTTKLFYIYSI